MDGIPRLVVDLTAISRPQGSPISVTKGMSLRAPRRACRREFRPAAHRETHQQEQLIWDHPTVVLVTPEHVGRLCQGLHNRCCPNS
eukprot:4835326-Prorocentrum_lima.AAC.1